MKDKKLHIVFLTPGFPESENDSTSIPALQVFLKSLRKRLPHAKMTLLAFQYPFSNIPYTWNGIQVIPLNGKNNRLKKFWIWNQSLKKLKKLHEKNPITIVHSFWIGECSFIGQKFSSKYKILHVTTAMGQDADLGNKYFRFLKRKDTNIVTLSQNHQNTLHKNYNLPTTIIPWHLDISSFPKLQENDIDILGVGSLNAIKDFPVFITIISKLIKTFPNIKVEIIGEGTQKKHIEESIKKLKLEKNISLTGKLPREKVLHKMSKSKTLLHTSTYESYGYVFAEALYSGMYIVSYEVGISQEIREWRICSTTTEMLSECEILHSNRECQEKRRVLLYPEKDTINAYLKLYNL